MRLVPWPDFAGNKIYGGSEIVHPSGDRGVVVFLENEKDIYDQWRVDYKDGTPLSRLCLQVGEKGQAIVSDKI